MRRAICIAVALAAVLSPAHLKGQILDGYYHASPESPLPDTLLQVGGDGRFRISVVRTYGSRVERELILVAESLTPTPAKFHEARTRSWAHEPPPLAPFPDEQVGRWWWQNRGGLLLPFALTGSAALYYVKRISDLSQQPNPFAQHNPGVQHRASVTYTARVEESSAVPGGFSVHLNLTYQRYCGPRCGQSLNHSRIVEFDANGIPLRIQGDQPPRLGEA